jgi:hypothetical protein
MGGGNKTRTKNKKIEVLKNVSLFNVLIQSKEIVVFGEDFYPPSLCGCLR